MSRPLLGVHIAAASTLVFGSLALLAAGWAAAASPPPALKYWSAAHCERVLPEEHPKIRHVICVGIGGPSRCRWTSGDRVRLYSELRVFAWYRHANFTRIGMHGLEPGVVRSFTLATRPRPGFARIYHRYGDPYVGQRADFYMGHVRLLATHVAAAHFRSLVAPIAARLTQQENATGCTGT